MEMYGGQKTVCRSQIQIVKLGYKDLYTLMHLADPRKLCVRARVCLSMLVYSQVHRVCAHMWPALVRSLLTH